MFHIQLFILICLETETIEIQKDALKNSSLIETKCKLTLPKCYNHYINV